MNYPSDIPSEQMWSLAPFSCNQGIFRSGEEVGENTRAGLRYPPAASTYTQLEQRFAQFSIVHNSMTLLEALGYLSIRRNMIFDWKATRNCRATKVRPFILSDVCSSSLISILRLSLIATSLKIWCCTAGTGRFVYSGCIYLDCRQLWTLHGICVLAATYHPAAMQ